jgi:hypothetical protein
MSKVFKTQDRDMAPAPWHAGEEFKPGVMGLQDVISVSGHGEVIAHVNCGFGRGKTRAKMIAALPELVALAEFVSNFNGSTGGPKALIAEFKFRANEVLRKIK